MFSKDFRHVASSWERVEPGWLVRSSDIKTTNCGNVAEELFLLSTNKPHSEEWYSTHPKLCKKLPEWLEMLPSDPKLSLRITVVQSFWMPYMSQVFNKCMIPMSPRLLISWRKNKLNFIPGARTTTPILHTLQNLSTRWVWQIKLWPKSACYLMIGDMVNIWHKLLSTISIIEMRRNQ